MRAVEAAPHPPESGQPTAIRRAALTQAQVIKGLGGIGKTQVAVEYAYRAREQGRYTYTLWITAASEETILMSFAALAELLPGVASSGETDQRKLVVAILLTTRASAVGGLAPSLEVDAMGVLEGAELLLRRAQRFAHATDAEINEAGNLVVALAQFPLALEQAGAYLEETGCSLRDCLQLYQTHRHALLARRGRQATRYPASVATTWSLSFQRVEEVNPAAAELLCLCAFLSPDRIPEELLTEGAPHWPPLLQQAVADRFRFNQLLETLLAFSLVKRLSEDRLLSVHRLVQAVQAERLSPEERRQWAERWVRAVHAVFPRDPQEAASWQACQRYLEQVQACDLLIQQHQLLLPEAAEVLERTGTYLRERALYSLAEPLYQQALAMREQHLGPEHLDVAESLHELAGLYRMQGKYTQAEPLYLRALRICEQQLGPGHLVTARVLHDFAGFEQVQGHIHEAASMYLRTLAIRENILGPEDPRTTETHERLQNVLVAMGRTQETAREKG